MSGTTRLISVAVILVALSCWFTVKRRSSLVPSGTPTSPRIIADQAAARTRVVSLLGAYRNQNADAVERTLCSISEMFNSYRRGVVPLSKDMTSMRTRFGILRRMPSDWWHGQDRMREYVQAKFEHHLFSEEGLHGSIGGVLSRFLEDLQANGNRLQSETGIVLRENRLPVLTMSELASYEERVRSSLVQYAGERGRSSVISGLATMATTEAVTVAGTQLFGRAAAAIGSAAAVSAIASGGATVKGAAVGAAGGGLSGPAGLATGVGVGLVIGVAVDWWMTDRCEARMQADLHGYLDGLESQMLDGSEADQGLREQLAEFATLMAQAHEEALRATLHFVAK